MIRRLGSLLLIVLAVLAAWAVWSGCLADLLGIVPAPIQTVPAPPGKSLEVSLAVVPAWPVNAGSRPAVRAGTLTSTVAAWALTVRSGPGVAYQPTAWLVRGQVVVIDGCQDGWGHAGSGWINTNWLAVDLCGGGQ